MEKTFSGTVKEKKQEERGLVLMLDIPTMGSKYPTSISDVPEEVWAKVAAGDVINVVLERQNARKTKGGSEYDGSKDWHWWWGWGRYATAQEGQKAQVVATVAVASEDRKEVSIRRAVALKAAVDLCAGVGPNVDMVLETAEQFDTWLATAPRPAPRTAQDTHQADPEEAPAPDDGVEIGDPVDQARASIDEGIAETQGGQHFGNVGELMDAVNKQYRLTTKQVCDILKVEYIGQIWEKYPALSVAWAKIVEAKKG